MNQFQGSKYDPDGEYVRQWLPELARMPAEWIHHPWDAPVTVLKAAGVELGLNYPKPIVDIDLSRERLTEAIFKMWETEAAARASNSSGENEVVVDNAGTTENLAIPIVSLKEKAPCSTNSSNDQRVPTNEKSKNVPVCRKRSNYMEEEIKNHDHLVGPSRMDEEELNSTAESAAAKKQATSRYSFSVPRYCSSSESKPLPDCESSGVNQPRQVQIRLEHNSSKDGKQLHLLFR